MSIEQMSAFTKALKKNEQRTDYVAYEIGRS